MAEIRVARVTKIGQPLELGTISKPVPGPKDVLVKVDACSVVPNTANLVTNELEDFHMAMAPLVFGLDVSGVIEAVGEHVMDLQVGDRVYVNPWITCDTCEACHKGNTGLCPNGALRGYFATDKRGVKTLERYPIGGLSEYLLSPDANIHVLPDDVELDTAARLGYIGTSYAGLLKGKVGPASTLLINGVTGTLGHAAVAIALGLGATKILGIGRDPDRLAEVDSLSSDKRLVVASSEEEKDLPAWIAKHTNGLGPDAMCDCLGNGGSAESAMDLIRTIKRGGSAILLAGGADGDLTQSYFEAMMHEVAIVGSMWFTSAQMDDLVQLISAGVIDMSFLEHKRFSLDNVNESLKFVGDRPSGSVNVVVKPGM